MIQKLLTCLLTTVMVFSLVLIDHPDSLTVGGVGKVQAASPVINSILGLFRIGGALSRRNRVYREANATTEEIHAYYDRLIEHAQTTRRDMIARIEAGDLSPRYISSYIRVEAALEAERQAAIRMIDAETNQARRDFEKTLVKEVVNILVMSPGGHRIIRQVGDSVWEARQAVVSVQNSLEEGKPTDMLGDFLAGKVGDIEVAQELARGLGSVVGQRLDRMLGGAVGKMEKAISNLQEGLAGGVQVLDQISTEIDRLETQARRPASMVEDGSMIGEIFPVDRANPVLDVVASAYAGATMLSGRNDPNATRADMMGRIRGALLDARTAGIRELVSGQAVGQTYCNAVGRGEFEVAALQLGQTPQQPENPETARYVVCYDIPSQLPVYARAFGSNQAEEETPAGTPEVEEGEKTAESQGPQQSSVIGTYRPNGEIINRQWLLVEEGKDEITINLAEDGSVTGTVNLSLLISFVNKDCVGKEERVIVGSISGQIISSDGGRSYGGQIEFAGTDSTHMIESCGLDHSSEVRVNQTGQITFLPDSMRGRFEDLFYFGWPEP